MTIREERARPVALTEQQLEQVTVGGPVSLLQKLGIRRAATRAEGVLAILPSPRSRTPREMARAINRSYWVPV